MIRILPFKFKKHFDGRILLVNECGDYYFLSKENFEKLISKQITENDNDFYNLKSRLFIDDDENYNFSIEKTSAKYRSRKAFLRDFTSLHMMVITLRCNQRCEYCQVSCADVDAQKYDMQEETAHKIVDMIFQSPAKNIKIEFQGGEPTLNWKTLKETVLYAKKKQYETEKNVEFVICTNLIGITEEQLEFCNEYGIFISTSFDGPKKIHDGQRILRIGDSSYEIFLNKLHLARQIIGENSIDALMTTTAQSLNAFHEIIDEYINLKFNGIFIRSLNPYGFAAEQNTRLGYSMENFVNAYIQAIEYLFQINRKIFFPEYFATLLLSRILTPFATGFVDLQSPAGVGISGVIYDYDGSVYPADEARMLARMGDSHFLLGNVCTNTYEAIFGGDKLRGIINNSCVEVIPGCAHCAYQAYCGADPIRNYLESGVEIRNMFGTNFCIKHRGIFDYLFEKLDKMTEEEENIIWRWIRHSRSIERNA
jgi:His-Xaa-Ser system radical SAM maturase HxsB